VIPAVDKRYSETEGVPSTSLPDVSSPPSTTSIVAPRQLLLEQGLSLARDSPWAFKPWALQHLAYLCASRSNSRFLWVLKSHSERLV
jgi:hypothetical protein